MRTALDRRTDRFALVLDSVHDPHNISAVLRSCDAFGLQDVHVVTQNAPFKINREVSMGCDRWLSVHKWHTYADCRAELKKRRFRIFVADMDEHAVPIYDLPLDRPLAIVLGNEHSGVGREARERCDGTVKIPMHGFVESLNVSVAAAIIISTTVFRLRSSPHFKGLPVRRKEELWDAWLRRQVRAADRILAQRR